MVFILVVKFKYCCGVYLKISPVSFDQRRRSSSAIGIPVLLEKSRIFCSILRYFDFVRVFGMLSIALYLTRFFSMCLSSIARSMPSPMFLRKWLDSL